jgi:hypothetical protein
MRCFAVCEVAIERPPSGCRWSDTNASAILRFVSRAEQLRLRGQRNYTRYKLIAKGFVAVDSLERAQWKKEDAEELGVTLSGRGGMVLPITLALLMSGTRATRSVLIRARISSASRNFTETRARTSVWRFNIYRRAPVSGRPGVSVEGSGSSASFLASPQKEAAEERDMKAKFEEYRP